MNKVEIQEIDLKVNLGKYETNLLSTDFVDEPIEEEFAREASNFSCIFNLSNTILGAGILSLPLALSLCGFYLGIILLLVFALGAYSGLVILSDCARWTGRRNTSYFVVALHTFPWASYLIEAAVVVKCFGVACSYLIIIGSSMSIPIAYWADAQPGDWVSDRRVYIALLAPLYIFFALSKTLDRLRYVSFVSVLAIIYLTVVVCAFYFQNPGTGDKATFRAVNDPLSVIQALPVLVFSFTCHQNVFAVSTEIKNNSRRHVNCVIATSIILSLSLYYLTGILGYFTFLGNVHSNLLNSYPSGDLFVNLCRLLMGIHGALTYPLQIHPARVSLDNLLFGRFKYLAAKSTPLKTPPPTPPVSLASDGDLEKEHRQMASSKTPAMNGKRGGGFRNASWIEESAQIRYWGESCLLIIGTIAVAMTVNDLSVVFGVVGSTGSTTLCYLLPGLFYVKMQHSSGNSIISFKCFMAMIMILFGIFMLFAGNFVVIKAYLDQ
eukprot:Sdes_comp19515_c0_seq1m11073